MRINAALFPILGALLIAPAIANGEFFSVDIDGDAEVGKVRFRPEQPAVHESFLVSVDVPGCMMARRNPDGLVSQVRIGADQKIAILISGVEHAIVCNLVSPPPPPHRFIQTLIGLQEGTWTVELYLSDPSESFPKDISEKLPFATGTAVVRGNQLAQPIPLLSPAGMTILLLALSLIAAMRIPGTRGSPARNPRIRNSGCSIR